MSFVATARQIFNARRPLVGNVRNFLILDFEATCQRGTAIQPQEIIEFPVILLDGKTLEEMDRFHRYVRPVHNPKLTDFCTELTGIIQDMVDFEAEFTVVMKDFCQWIEGHFPAPEDREALAFVTCGDWDLKCMLPSQARLSGVEVPEYCRRWINIKKVSSEYIGSYVGGLIPILRALEISPSGRLHSGIDDSVNIAKILRTLVAAKVDFRWAN